MATSKKLLITLTEQLAAITDLPLVLDIHNPGDYTRFRIYTAIPNRSGVSERPFGNRSYKAGEMESAIRMAISGAESVLPDEVVSARMSAYWAKKHA